MNRFEILRGFNIFLMIPLSILAILGVIATVVSLSVVFAIATGVFIILVFGLKYTLGPLTMRIHEEYFPRKKHNPISDVVYTPSNLVDIPSAKLV